MKKQLALALVAYASFALAQASAQTVPDWEKKWNQLVADAKKEGKVVIIAPPDPQVRAALPAAFKAKYGITVDYLGGRSSETAAKMRAERNAGVHTVDVALSGIQTMAAIFYREKMIDPIDDTVLIHPEVTEGKYWQKGKPWFMDPEGKYILRLFNTISAMFYLNTSIIKPEEIKSAQDLLNPKWKGKIVARRPCRAPAVTTRRASMSSSARTTSRSSTSTSSRGFCAIAGRSPTGSCAAPSPSRLALKTTIWRS